MKHWAGRGLPEWEYMLYKECLHATYGTYTTLLEARLEVIGYLNALLDYNLISADEYGFAIDNSKIFIKSIIRHKRRK